ncbi:uncharacterized protein TNCV_3615921 [Trichonephila clavipes]|nr:uncharacterized protein TNCV_3615921 [Trichonephila clavipes]
MSSKSPFAIQNALVRIGGEPKSVKRLRSGDLLIETLSTIQKKSFLLEKTFLDSPVTICSHQTLNSCRGVISEPDQLTTTDAEILDGFSGQGVIQEAKTRHRVSLVSPHVTTLEEDLKQQPLCQDSPKDVLSDSGLEVELAITFVPNRDPPDTPQQSELGDVVHYHPSE